MIWNVCNILHFNWATNKLCLECVHHMRVLKERSMLIDLFHFFCNFKHLFRTVNCLNRRSIQALFSLFSNVFTPHRSNFLLLKLKSFLQSQWIRPLKGRLDCTVNFVQKVCNFKLSPYFVMKFYA